MARELTAPTGEVRVLFTAAEAEGFLRGWTPLPDGGYDDPLASAVRRVLQGLTMEFAAELDCVEVCVERAPGPMLDGEGVDASAPMDERPRTWYVVRFRIAGPDSGAAEQQPMLDAWIADHAPALAFAVESAADG